VARPVRVVISPPTPADEAEFIAGNRRSRKLQGRWGRMPETPEEYAVYLAKAAEERRRYFFARLRDGGDIVGYLNLGEIIHGSLDQAFIGYGAIAGHEGRGLMSEAMQLVLREAFGPLKLHRIEANIQPGNRPSIALAQRNGFQLEGFSPRYLKINGRWRDHERWAITAEQWREHRKARPPSTGSDPV
jgi:[ribosomal protein S5]-alanine N-acetyltransferase